MKNIVIIFLLVTKVNLILAQVMGTPIIGIPYTETNKPLDKISVSAAGAYSMRLLRSGYTGYCMKIRRSNDNATLDVGFDANGNLNTGALLTFVGANSAYVVTWYDQSGNSKNLNQTTNSYQPRIVNAGILDKENNIAFIRFFGIPGSSTYNYLSLPAEQTTTSQVIATHKFDTSSSANDGFILGSTTTYNWHSAPPNNLLIGIYSASINNAVVYQNRVQRSVSTNTTVWNTKLGVNSVAPQTPNSGTAWDNIGRDRTFHPITGGGGYSELLFFTATLPAADRELLEWSAMSYFNVL